MRRNTVPFLCLLLLLIFLSGCFFAVPEDEVILSIGEVEERRFYSSGGFQDFTDYGKYSFVECSLADNPYLKPLSEEDCTVFGYYLDDFEGWVDMIAESEPKNELPLNYDFSRSQVDSSDYFYLYTDPDYHSYGEYNISGYYRLYFFDTQSQILFYFRNNI